MALIVISTSKYEIAILKICILLTSSNNQISKFRIPNILFTLELVSKELNHLAAILHVYAGGLNFMK